jgi:hypothetical protein
VRAPYLPRRLTVRLLVTAVVLILVDIAGVRWLDGPAQGWLLLGCTTVGVLVGASLFWMTDREIGWVAVAALLLAVTPLAVDNAASKVALSARGHLDQCQVTGIRSHSGAGDALPGIRYRQELDCSAAGRQEVLVTNPWNAVGQRVTVWVDGAAEGTAEAVKGDGAPSPGPSMALALLVLAGLVGSGVAAARRLGRRNTGSALGVSW